MNLKNKYINAPTTLKVTFWFTFSNILLKGISFISVPLFTRLLSTSEFGKMSVFYSFEQIFLIFSTFEFYNGAYQRGIMKYKNDEEDFLQSTMLLSFLLTIATSLVVLCSYKYLSNILNVPYLLLGLMFINFIFIPSYNFWLVRERFKYNYKPVTFFTLNYAIVTTLLSLLAVKYIENTATMKIATTYLASIILTFPFFIKHFNIKKLLIKTNKIKLYFLYLLSFQTPLIFHSLSFLVLMQADRIMISYLVGNSKAALYSVAYSMATTVSLVQISINQVYKPFRYQKLESKEYSEIKNSTSKLLFIMMLSITIFVLIVPEIFKLMFKEVYYESIYLIPPISVSMFFMFLYTIFTDIESYFHKTNFIAYISIFCAILNIILNYFGINFFGYQTCGYITLICYIVFGILHYLVAKNIIKKEKILFSDIFDKNSIILISLIMLLILPISLLLFRFIFIRYLIVLVFIISFIYNRKTFLRYMRLKK